MRKLLLGTTLTLAIAFVSPASAMPAGYQSLRDAAVSIDLIEVGDAKVGGTSTVIARLVGARPQGGLARRWLPTRSLEEGLVLKPDGQFVGLVGGG